MVSLHTNTSAIAALQSLKSIDRNLATEQNRVSSGYRVANAADNSTYWSISTTMKSEVKSLSTVSDAIGLSQSIFDAAYDGMTTAMGYLEEVRNLFILARGMPDLTEDDFDSISPNPTTIDEKFSRTNLGKINSEMNQLLAGATNVIKMSSFGGINLLHNSDPTVGIADAGRSFVTGYSAGAVQTIETDPIVTTLFSEEYPFHLAGPVYEDRGILDKSDVLDYPGTFASWQMPLFNNVFVDEVYYYADDSKMNPNPLLMMERGIVRHDADRAGTYKVAIDYLDGKIEKMKDGAAYLGAIQSSLVTQDNLVKDRIASYEKGIGRLIDADMNESSSRIKALQVQQQLGMQALQISNNAPDILLTLYTG